MPSLDLFSAAPLDWLAVDRYVREFELARGGGPLDDWSPYLPQTSDAQYRTVLCELVRVDMELCWEEGERLTVADYRERFPDLFREHAYLSQVAFEEFRLRRAAGENPDATQYEQAFGIYVSDWRLSKGPSASIVSRIAIDPSNVVSAISEARQRSPEPAIGDRLFGFELIEPLGRGAVGRVFLAEQADLANRRVVLKFSKRLWGESQTLAQLQHTNIVPIVSSHRHEEWQVICMPYFGRATLEDLLRAAIDSPTADGQAVSGAAIVSTIRGKATDTTAADESKIGAEGNASATTSRPVSASEVGDRAMGQWRRDGYANSVLRLMLGVARGLAHAHERGVVHCDLKPANVLLADDLRPMILDFNLAATASERNRYVGGSLPYMAPESLAALDSRPGDSQTIDADPRSDVYSLGVMMHELLVRKRAPTPDKPRAASPADWLATRCDPWPSCRSSGVSPSMQAIVAKCLAVEPAKRYPSGAALCEDLERQLHDFPLRHAGNPSLWEQVGKFRRRWPKLTSVATVSIAAAAVILLMATATFAKLRQRDRYEAVDLARQTSTDLRSAQLLLFQPDATKKELASGLALCEKIATRHGADENGEWWRLGAATRLTESERQRLRQEVDAAVQLRSGTTAGSREGERPVLLAAADAYRGGDYESALGLIRPLTQESPDSFEGWLLLGHCHAQRGNHREAASAYSVCVALAPESDWAWFNRGVARLESAQFTGADEDFTRVLKTPRRRRESLVNRGLARMATRRFEEAKDDFTAAIKLPSPTCRMYFLRARAFAALGDAEQARRDREHGMATAAESAADWVARGVVKIGVDREAALADFDAAIALDSRCRAAWENRAAVLSADPAKLAEAISSLDELLTHYPEYAVARMGRAVLLARSGEAARAIDDADRALVLDARPAHVYQAACVRALLSRFDPDHKFKAIELLSAALRQGFGRDIALADEDLALLRDEPGFLALVSSRRPTNP